MAQHNDLGRWGEDVAANYLREKGWYIRDRNWRFDHKELDIVAIDELSTTLLIVEVKTRSDETFGSPEEAVTLQKMNHLIRAASQYVCAYHIPWVDVRYDIVAVIGTPDTPVQIRHTENAFNVSMQLDYKNELRRQRRRRW